MFAYTGGLQGIQGVKGDAGDQGIQGVKGDAGDQGIQGVKGDKGDTGDTGAAGGFESRVRLSRESTGQVIAPTTWTKVEWDTERYDILGEGVIADPWKITVQADGYYRITTNIAMQDMGAGRDVRAQLTLNGGSMTANGHSSGGQADADINIVSSTPYLLSNGDYLEVYVWHNDTTDRTLAGGSFLSVERFA